MNTDKETESDRPEIWQPGAVFFLRGCLPALPELE